MAKTITAMGIGLALREGSIKSLDDKAEIYAPTLAGTIYGEATPESNHVVMKPNSASSGACSA